MIESFFALLGGAAGAAQARLLARDARGVSNPALGFARLLLVGAVLFIAARSGHLRGAAAGWVVGFAFAGIAVHRRLR